MANRNLRSVLKRIDVDLDKAISDFAKKNKLSYREASREVAKENLIKKFKKEIKI